jgi:hypothetical protein
MKQLNTMRNLLTGVLAMVFVLGCAGQINAQIAAWDLTGVSSPATTNATLVNANLESPITLTRGAGAAASSATNSFRTTGFQNNGISTANTDYFQFTLNPSSGFTMSLSSINARVNGTATYAATPGVSQQYAYSTNGTDFTLIGSPSVTIGTDQTFSVDVSGISTLQEVPEGVTIYIRYYASGQTTTGGWGFFSSGGLTVNGTVDVVAGAVVPPSSVTATAVSSTQINLSWNQNDSTDDILLAVNSTATFGEPTGTYSVSDAITGGGTVIAVGALASFNHTSLDPNTGYFYSIWSKDGSNVYSPSVATSATSAKGEPSNHVTNAEMLSGRNAIIVKWDDATAGVLPDGYLVKVSNTGFGSITAPVDGTDPSNDFDLTDGSASVKVEHGTGFISFVGLDQGQTYYAKIFPYTNEGTLIDFKIDGSVPGVETTVQSYIRVFKETFSTESTTVFDSYSSSDNPGFSFAGNGDVRTSLASSGYNNASGGGNAFFTNSPRELVISHINTTGLENPSIQFGMNSASGVGLTVEVSDDGISYTLLPYNPRPAVGWNLETIAGAQLPEGENIRLKFTNNSNSIRLDDLELFQVGYSNQLTGSEGYRLLSSPVATTLESLLKDNNIFTQCFTGATYNDTACEATNVGPNVFFFNATSGEYEAATNITNAVPAGTGVLVYVYGKNNIADESPTWPKTVSVSGVAHTLPVSPTLNTSADGFTLLGNPTASTISFDAFDINADVNEVVYTWNVNSGTDLNADEYGSGSWISYNGKSGDLTGGLLAPFQGFFVQTAEGTPSPTLSIASAAISGSAGTFYGKERESLSARLTLSGEGLGNATWLSFNEAASIGRDRADALQLEPLSRNFAVISTQDTDGRLLDINNLPFIDEELELPLIVRATRNGEYTIALSSMNLPENFSLHLRDNELGITQKIDESFVYDFSYTDAVVAKSAGMGNVMPEAMLAEDKNSRFTLIVAPTITLDAGEVRSELPDRLALGQNYPNPFNPTTRISFELPSSQFVKLSVFNMLGQEVSTLLQTEMNAGSHFVNFDASQLSSGVYVYRLEAGGQVITRKMTLVK